MRLRWALSLTSLTLVLPACGDTSSEDTGNDTFLSTTLPSGTDTNASQGTTTANETSGADAETATGDGDGDTGDGDGDTGDGDGDSGDGDTGDGDTGDGDGDGGDGDSGDGDSGDGDSGDGDTGDGDGDGDSTSTSTSTTGEPCVECTLSIASQQSGGIIVNDNMAVFATAELMNEIVYAMGDYGAGRFIASGDSSLPFKEVTDCPIVEWLGGNGLTPSILIFGWGPSDGPGSWPPQADIQGIHLPAQYIGNAAQLKADYDIIVYLEGSGQFGTDEPTDQEMDTVLDFMSTYGGGVYITSEFFGYLNSADITSVNRLMLPVGVEANPINLNWGGVNGEIAFECFPPIPE